jgi:D-glycero-alpha-D-manno-heptose-7-phosphate kinase
LVVYTGQQLFADAILEGVRLRMADRRGRLEELRDYAGAMKTAICSGRDLIHFGRLLHESWLVKRSLDARISTEQIDTWYAAARGAGAWGGKLLGAGGGGFTLLFAPPERHAAILEKLGRPRSIAFEISDLGSQIVYASHRAGCRLHE